MCCDYNMDFEALLNRLDNSTNDNETIKIIDEIDLCPDCNIPLTLIERESMSHCQQCGHSIYKLTTMNAYDSNYSPKSFYKRINHFNNTLRCLESYDRNTIPDNVV